MLGIRKYKGVAIDLWQGDITQFVADAIVNAANKELAGGGGVDGAIHKAGGPSIMDECRKLGPIETGDAVKTTAGDLPAEIVIHTAGPVWEGGQNQEPELLARAYQNSLKLVESSNLRHVSLSAISTGVYGYPLEEAAQVAMKCVKECLDKGQIGEHVKRITFVLFSRDLYRIFQDQLFATFPEAEDI